MNLKELSEKLGLSQTTVSRALNGYPEVSEATRARVLAAAHRFDYRPSTRAKALATGRSMAIGHVISISDRHEMVNPIFADFIAGAAESYLVGGYRISLAVVPDSDVGKAYRDFATEQSVDGVIVHGPRVDDERIDLLRSIGLPFLVHGRASDHANDYSWIDVDNKRSFRRATEFLADLGHSRIALVNGLEFMDFAARRRNGYLEGLDARGINVDPDIMRSDEMTESYGFSVARDLLRLPNPPTAFLAASTITSFGIRRALDDAGLQLGREVSLITHDDDLSYFRNGGDDLIFTALRSSVREAGRRAGQAIINLINRPDDLIQTMLETDFIVGQSTGPIPARARAAS